MTAALNWLPKCIGRRNFCTILVLACIGRVGKSQAAAGLRVCGFCLRGQVAWFVLATKRMAKSNLAKSSEGLGCVFQGLLLQVRFVKLVAISSMASNGRAAMRRDGAASRREQTGCFKTQQPMHPPLYAPRILCTRRVAQGENSAGA